MVAQRSVAVDALCVAGITVLSALPYLAGLGFYGDDWSLLARFAGDRSGWFEEATRDVFVARPVQGLYFAGLYELFGLRPLGHHIVNTLVLSVCAALFYLLLVRLRFGRALAFAAAILFIMLPQLSTVRVWFAAFQIPLSLALMLISIHCQLSFARRRSRAWLAGAIVAAVLSIAAYEIFAPILAGFAAGLLFLSSRRAPRAQRKRSLVSAAAVLGIVVLAAAYKLMFSGRTGDVVDPHRYVAGLIQFFRVDYDWRVDSSLNLFATTSAHFWAPVRGYWTGAQGLFSGNAGAQVTIIAIFVAAVAWWRLNSADQPAGTPAPRRLLALGIAAFVLGNVTFLIVPAVAFTSTGIGNRVHVAAALGVAAIFTAIIALLTAAAPVRVRGIIFNAAIAVVTASALVRLASIERYWAEAPAIQERILAAARADLRQLPAQATVIMDGVCPYHGPALVFEAWDVGGALTLALGRRIRGDVVSSRMTATASGLMTSLYDDPRFFPYGERLYIYNPAARRLYRINDRPAAARYFAGRKRLRCGGYVARGVEV